VTASASRKKGPTPYVWSSRYAPVAASTATSAPAGASARNSTRSAVRGPGGRVTVKEHCRGAPPGAQHARVSSAGCDESVMPAPTPLPPLHAGSA